MGSKRAHIGDIERKALQILNAAYLQSGLTQQQIADKAGVSRTTVQKSLSGKRATTYTELSNIATALGFQAWRIYKQAEEELSTPQYSIENGKNQQDYTAAADQIAGQTNADIEREQLIETDWA